MKLMTTDAAGYDRAVFAEKEVGQHGKLHLRLSQGATQKCDVWLEKDEAKALVAGLNQLISEMD
jgi:hypothetical protein